MASPLCSRLLAVLALALGGCASEPAMPPRRRAAGLQDDLATPGSMVDAIAMRDLISIYRHNHGLPPLAIDPELEARARQGAEEMARAGKAGARFAVPGRAHVVANVSAGYHSVADAFSGWRGEPGQDARMLDPRARRMGVAAVYAPASRFGVFWALVLTD